MLNNLLCHPSTALPGLAEGFFSCGAGKKKPLFISGFAAIKNLT
jgi:hypothetical protein